MKLFKQAGITGDKLRVLIHIRNEGKKLNSVNYIRYKKCIKNINNALLDYSYSENEIIALIEELVSVERKYWLNKLRNRNRIRKYLTEDEYKDIYNAREMLRRKKRIKDKISEKP